MGGGRGNLASFTINSTSMCPNTSVIMQEQRGNTIAEFSDPRQPEPP